MSAATMTWMDANTSKPPPYEAVLIATEDQRYRVAIYDPVAYGAGAWLELSSHDLPPCRLSVAFWAKIESAPKGATTMTDVSTFNATTIPPDQIRNAGVPVFPVLRQHIRGSVRLNRLIDERERYGLTKYGQPLMTDDGRDTPTEINGEAGDLLAYVTKLAMQRDTALAWDLLTITIAFVEDALEAIEEIGAQQNDH